MICFAGITPHTPLLIPGVGKENRDKLIQTTKALSCLAEDLYASRPDTIVVISGHTTQYENSFSLNLQDEYLIGFKDFGDLSTTRNLRGDVALATEIQSQMYANKIPFTLDSDNTLNYGTGVPLYFLTEKLPNTRVLPLSYSGLSAKEHVAFGGALKDVFEHSSKRIAVIASGDLSHCLSSDAPLGFKAEGEIYDKKILETVSILSASGLLSMPEELIKEANACLRKQLLVLFGVIERKKARVEILSYEHPFGVGYLVAQIHL